jgi:hypothetical protein
VQLERVRRERAVSHYHREGHHTVAEAIFPLNKHQV